MPTPVHHITICGVGELPKYRTASVDYMLTALNPEECKSNQEAWEGFAVKHEFVRFNDVAMPQPGACTHAHIEKVLEFGERVKADSHLLVHCHAGVSRSPAVAAILLCQHAPGREAEAFARLHDVRPQARPNPLVVQIGDEVLGRNGALQNALDGYLLQVFARGAA